MCNKILMLIIVVTLTGCTTCKQIKYPEMDAQEFMCETATGSIVFVAPMPSGIDKQLLEEYAEFMCESMYIEEDLIAEALITEDNALDGGYGYDGTSPYSSEYISTVSGGTAVCDTDTNCIIWEAVHRYGVKRVFTAPDNMNIGRDMGEDGNAILEIHCMQHNIVKYSTGYYKELEVICTEPSEIVTYLTENSENYPKEGYTDFAVNLAELEYLVNNGYAPLDRYSNSTPTIKQFLDLMTEHPEVEAGGSFNNSKDAIDLCANSSFWYDKSACYDAHYGLSLDEVFIRFGTNNSVGNWFLDFCEDADEYPTSNSYRCWWD